ncbi:MAG: imidazole glycerol phosphate synthase subunit HisH [Candidatus Planktophila sp.]
MAIAILDYGSGNLRSALRAFERAGRDVVLTSDYSVALEAEGLVVPGVGAFGACMQGLASVKGDALVRERVALARPTIGICVGMQILFAHGVEHGEHDGVGIWPSTVEKLSAPVLPHMGWNTVEIASGSNLFKGVEGESFYFVHSYGVTQKVETTALQSWTDYDSRFLAAIEDGVMSATQFHPEKSGAAGLHLIKNWVSTL